MSTLTASNRDLPDLDPEVGLMFSVADQLIPLFKIGSIDVPLARRMAVSAIEAYQPETRADFVNVARTIAFSMAALSLLGTAASQDMTMPEKMRAFVRANALNRSADQSERTMMQRRRYQQANPSAEPPDQGREAPAPEAEITDAQLEAAVADVMSECQAALTPANTKAAAPEAPSDPAPAAPETAAPQRARVVSQPQPPAAIPAAAIRYSVPGPDAAQPPAPYKEGLLRQSAMQRVIEQNGTQPTR